MSRLPTLVSVAGLLLATACSSLTDLDPTESCIGESGDARTAFEDPALEAAVKEALGVAASAELTCGSMSHVTALDASNAGVTSLQGIQNLVNLRYLDLNGNALDDLTPLSGLEILHTLFIRSSGLTSLDGLQGLTSLAFLDLNDNSIGDVGPLAGLTGLIFLDLTENQIGDLGPLSGLTLALALRLGANSVSDIGALSGLASVVTLSLYANDITDLTALAALPRLATLDLSDNVTLSDIQPLIDNEDMGDGDAVNLRGTAVDCPSVGALRAKGVIVDYGCV